MLIKRSVLAVAAVLAVALVVGGFSGVRAASSKASPFKVAGTEFDPQHNCDANADWVKGIGLTGTKDPYAYGFLMHKLCSTDANAASFGLISGVKGQFLDTLGFDYKNVNGGFTAHCGAGAPRFNVSMSDGTFHFIGGCANGTQSESPAGTGWTRVRFDPGSPLQAFPPVAANSTIVSISLVFDEGSDSDPSGNGSPEIVLDNIVVNGNIATKP